MLFLSGNKGDLLLICRIKDELGLTSQKWVISLFRSPMSDKRSRCSTINRVPDAFIDESGITTTQESIIKESFNEKKKKKRKKGN